MTLLVWLLVFHLIENKGEKKYFIVLLTLLFKKKKKQQSKCNEWQPMFAFKARDIREGWGLCQTEGCKPCLKKPAANSAPVMCLPAGTQPDVDKSLLIISEARNIDFCMKFDIAKLTINKKTFQILYRPDETYL